jgi:hypothetical protein
LIRDQLNVITLDQRPWISLEHLNISNGLSYDSAGWQFGKRWHVTLTNRLAKRLPKGRWGAARKFLNLYLRRTTYNFYLRQAYGLDRIEPFLELPMDSFAAEGLKQEPEGKNLPDWLGVRHLTPEANAIYQAVASRVAERLSTERLSICRIHLDMKYWRAKPKGHIRRIGRKARRADQPKA